MAHNTAREPNDAERPVVNEVLSLYQLHPTEKSYAHYRSDAVFHDPVSTAHGLDKIKSQFNGMTKLFERSDTIRCEVIDDGFPDTLVLDLTQHYVFKGAKHPEKTLNSKITLKRDHDGMIYNHLEEWDHKKAFSTEEGYMGDGFVGDRFMHKLSEWRRKGDARLIGAFFASDPRH